jgi:cytidylate kinase
MKRIIIAIDGPAGAGKSSVAKALSARIGYDYIDTGAMYRCLTLYILRLGIASNDEKAICQILKNCVIEISGNRFFLNGEDVTTEIRSKEVTQEVSTACAHPCVRNYMVKQQRHLARHGGVILDGRDIGTFVFPDAELKIYQTASLDVRAMRRYQENKVKNLEMSIEEVKQDIIRRDLEDSSRPFAPLKKAEDAVLIDTSKITQEQAVNIIIDLVKDKIGAKEND